jgi:hypothetical protein
MNTTDPSIADLKLAVAFYRIALTKARDCCGCGEGAEEECAADLLTGSANTWRDDIVDQARVLIEA